MITPKTPEQIADEQMEAFTIAPDSNYEFGGNDANDVEECSASYIRDQIIEAIKADRAQRPQRPAYKTLGDVAAEIRRMRADGVTVGSVEYAMSRVFAEEQEQP